jgi:hypothetical protein
MDAIPHERLYIRDRFAECGVILRRSAGRFAAMPGGGMLERRH